MIHFNLIDGKICTAMILLCGTTCLGLLGESKAQIDADTGVSLSIKDVRS